MEGTVYTNYDSGRHHTERSLWGDGGGQTRLSIALFVKNVKSFYIYSDNLAVIFLNTKNINVLQLNVNWYGCCLLN
jgi:hypothetical protein